MRCGKCSFIHYLTWLMLASLGQATRKGCTCEDGKCLDLVLARGDYDKVCPCILAEWECSPELCAGVRYVGDLAIKCVDGLSEMSMSSWKIAETVSSFHVVHIVLGPRRLVERLKKTVKHTCKHMQLQKDKKPVRFKRRLVAVVLVSQYSDLASPFK